MSPMKTIRWGIWGAGAIAHQVASDFPLADGAVIHGVASRRGERAKGFAARHGVARSYEGLAALLKDAEVDAVYIATPNQCHAADSIACLEAGKGVLCEKPFALNAKQAQEVVDAARRRGVFCMEGMWTRFIPALQEAKRSIDAGAIGKVRLVQGNFAHAAPVGPGSRFFDIEAGGGALLDLGVYLVSLTQWLLGVPETVRGTATVGATGVDEQSAYQLGFTSGALAELAASLHVHGSNEVTIYGETGSLRLCEPFYRAHRMEMKAYARPVASAREDLGAPPTGLRKVLGGPGMKGLRRRLSGLEALARGGQVKAFPFAGNGYRFELMEASRCVREGLLESKVMPLEDSLAVMRTMDALRAQWGLVYPQEQSGGSAG
jgi:predicted dehydrogenase